jgi:hypothetical protein
MATPHSTAKARSGRNRPSKAETARRSRAPKAPGLRKRETSSDQAGGPGNKHRDRQHRVEPQGSDPRAAIRIHGRLREFLDAEQGFLLKVDSLLLCIAKSMDDSAHPSTGPYYPDVVELASELLRRRARNFDELLLDGRLPAVEGDSARVK